jgi:hypothetical protein
MRIADENALFGREMRASHHARTGGWHLLAAE